MTPEEIAMIGTHRQFKHDRDEQQGAEFGLRICRLLVQLHGGELTIKSEPKKGTIVTVVFRQGNGL